MKQIWITGKGGPDKLIVREGREPECGPQDVRIRVEAAGVNFADIMMRLGLYPDGPKPPMVPGYEVAGVVDAVGAGADSTLVGQPVVAMCNFGGYSETVCVPHQQVWHRPANVDAVTAAALPVNYITAWQMVRVMAPVQSGDVVLIHSAAGGVGQAVIQLCQLAGARVIGSASSSKHAFLRDQGLEFVFDSQDRHFAGRVKDATDGRGADVVLEPRNGRWINESYEALAKCGRLVLFGFSNAAIGNRSGTLSAIRTLAGVPWLKINPIRLMNDNKSVAGVNLGRMWDQLDKTGLWVDQLLELLASGKIKPRVDRIWSFDDVAQAHRHLEERRNLGKVVLVPNTEEDA